MEHAIKQETAFVGIETSKLLLKAVLRSGGDVLCKVLENDVAGYRWLRSWLQKNDVPVLGLRVCMRLDAPYSEAPARALADMGMLVCAAQPAQLEDYLRGQGLPEDAAHGAVVLANYCADNRPARWTPPSPSDVELRLWLRRLHAIQGVRQQESARLDAHLQAGQHALHALVRQQIACLDAQIRQHEAAIREHMRRAGNTIKTSNPFPFLSRSRRQAAFPLHYCLLKNAIAKAEPES
jgi:transposase